MTSNRITLDYALAMAEGLGSDSGLSDAELDALAPRFAQVCNALLERTARGELGFFDLPRDTQALARAAGVQQALDPGVRDVLLLGIGGSSLGSRALIEALRSPQGLTQPERDGKPRLHFPDNSDPWVLSHLLETLEPRTTAVIVISKSGGTVETAAQMLIVRQWLERGVDADGARTRLVAITDPKSGTLRAMAERDGLPTLEIPSNVGGRFSALTAVGLLPACIAGIDAAALLKGAADMAERCKAAKLRDNPAGLVAAIHYLHHTQKGRPIHVLMPYSDRLRAFAAWYVQLWAESLGKRNDLQGRKVETGPTPLPAVGATDQHAQVQLFMEGPRDKLVTFLSIEQPARDLSVPAATGADAYLSGMALSRLLEAECQGTSEALASDGRPSVRIAIDKLDAYTFGGLVMLYEAATAFAGGLYGIDPFDQPGVELGKRLAFGLLGRQGYEAAAKEIRDRLSQRTQRYRV
jgi:glucose-6-phosphate isomerase